MEEKKQTSNPIDPDKVAENPHLLPYAHTVGGAVIKPIDRGQVKGLALKAMYKQTDQQLEQIKEQISLLAVQAKEIQDRVIISEQIYQATCGFKPLIGHNYFLYNKTEEYPVLSMIGPNEWGKTPPYQFVAEVELLPDHTWKVISKETP
ncbi:MAG: DUF2452 domain-containing protein [Saprospiraceae bacterium]|nr:DUF2452 domain-containing protein [Saprospiraceae bacterium]